MGLQHIPVMLRLVCNLVFNGVLWGWPTLDASAGAASGSTWLARLRTPFNLYTVACVKPMQSKIAKCPFMGLQQVPVMQKVCSPSIASPCVVISSHAGVCCECDIVLQDHTLLSSTEPNLVRFVV